MQARVGKSRPILNNGNLKINYPDIDNLSIVVSLEFDPGLYYWKLVGEDELYQVGKVILKEKQ